MWSWLEPVLPRSNRSLGSARSLCLCRLTPPPLHTTQSDELRACITEYAELAVWTAVADADGDPMVVIDAADLGAAAAY
jgi:hypothetical protein